LPGVSDFRLARNGYEEPVDAIGERADIEVQ